MDAEEAMKKHGAAASYAKQFLVNKYREEYAELYSAYCRNRGLGTRAKPKAMIDERELVNE
jgi:hypothetical protein